MLRSCSSSVHFVEGRSTSLIERRTTNLLSVDKEEITIRHLTQEKGIRVRYRFGRFD